MINDEIDKVFNSISGNNGIPFIYVPIQREFLRDELRKLLDARLDKQRYYLNSELQLRHDVYQPSIQFGENI